MIGRTLIQSPMLSLIKIVAENSKHMSPKLQDSIAEFIGIEIYPRFVIDNNATLDPSVEPTQEDENGPES